MRTRAVIWAALASVILAAGSASADPAPDWSAVTVADGAFGSSMSPATFGASGKYTWTETLATEKQLESLWMKMGISASNFFYKGFVLYDHTDADLHTQWGEPGTAVPLWEFKEAKAHGSNDSYLEWKAKTGNDEISATNSLQTAEFWASLTPDANDVAPTAVFHIGWDQLNADGSVTTGKTAWCTSGVTPAPEPASLVLLGCAAGAGAWVRRRKRGK